MSEYINGTDGRCLLSEANFQVTSWEYTGNIVSEETTTIGSSDRTFESTAREGSGSLTFKLDVDDASQVIVINQLLSSNTPEKVLLQLYQELEVTTLTFTDDSGNTNDNYGGYYADLYVGHDIHRFWWDVADGDAAPADPGTLHEIDIATDDDEDAVAAATSAVIHAVSGLSSDYSSGASFNVTHELGAEGNASENTSVMTVTILVEGAQLYFSAVLTSIALPKSAAAIDTVTASFIKTGTLIHVPTTV